MAEHDRTPVVFGARMARNEHGRMIGYEAFRGERGSTKYNAIVTVVGPVRDDYQQAADDARAAHDEEFGRPHFL